MSVPSATTIESWSLHFRGDNPLDGSGPGGRLDITTARTDWSSDPSHVMHVRDIDSQPVTLVSVSPDEAARIESPEPPWVRFHGAGYLAEPDWNLTTTHSNALAQIGSTENVSIRATVRTRTAFGSDEVVGRLPADTLTKATAATRIRDLPMADTSDAPDTPGDVELATFDHFQPILYLEQGRVDTGGMAFVLLAELSNRDSGIRHILFSILPYSPPLPANQGLNRQRYISGRQLSIISPPFKVSTNQYTVRVHQDGDLYNDKRYFEFWINDLPLGFHRLWSTGFPFNTGPTRVGIGYWPRRTDDKQDFYFQGEIAEIIVDPHGNCGC